MVDNKQEKYNFHSVIPWHVLKKHLARLEKKTIARFRKAVGDDVLRVQAELCLLDRLMDLPEALILEQEDDEKGS